MYTRDDVERLTFIRRCREFDFSIEQVRALVAIMQNPKSSCMDAHDMAAEHLTAVRAKMRELKALERSLVAFVKSCDTSCAGGPGPGLRDPGRPREILSVRAPPHGAPGAIMIQNLLAFTAAAVLEILGCFTFWLWLRRGASPAIAALGILSLIGFAIALTRVDAVFAGRAYAGVRRDLHCRVGRLVVAR